MKSKKDLSAQTIDSYLCDIKQYIDFVQEKGISHVQLTSNASIISYMVYLEENAGSSSTIHRKLSSLRGYYNYLLLNRMIDKNPMVRLEPPKTQKRIPEILTHNEVELLLNQPDGEDARSIRDKAMLELLYATGMRVSELISLDINNINIEKKYLEKVGLASRKRTVPIPSRAFYHLEKYMHNSRIKLLGKKREEALFVNSHGKRMTRQGLWKILKQYKKKASINKDITPQTLRHSFAVHSVKRGIDICYIQKILGHSDISTTQKYNLY